MCVPPWGVRRERGEKEQQSYFYFRPFQMWRERREERVNNNADHCSLHLCVCPQFRPRPPSVRCHHRLHARARYWREGRRKKERERAANHRGNDTVCACLPSVNAKGRGMRGCQRKSSSSSSPRWHQRDAIVVLTSRRLSNDGCIASSSSWLLFTITVGFQGTHIEPAELAVCSPGESKGTLPERRGGGGRISHGRQLRFVMLSRF